MNAEIIKQCLHCVKFCYEHPLPWVIGLCSIVVVGNIIKLINPEINQPSNNLKKIEKKPTFRDKLKDELLEVNLILKEDEIGVVRITSLAYDDYFLNLDSVHHTHYLESELQYNQYRIEFLKKMKRSRFGLKLESDKFLIETIKKKIELRSEIKNRLLTMKKRGLLDYYVISFV